MIIAIVAIAKNLAIGKDGKLPWHYSSDLRHFKETTTGNAIVMGASTWRELGRPLPNRLNVILSRSIEVSDLSNLLVARNRDQILCIADYLRCDLYVIGGAKTFDVFAADREKWIVTRIPVVVEDADVSMPANFLDGFEIERKTDLNEGLKVEVFRRLQT